MFSWSPRHRLRIGHVEAEAEALISYFGVEAYSEARRRERQASSDAIAKDWGRVALTIACKTKGLEGKAQKVDPIDELKRLIGGLE
jgi:hypothetical protein